jgi:cell division protein FtsB
VSERQTPPRERFPLLLGAAVVLVLVLVGAAALRSWQDLAQQRAREAAAAADIARTEAGVRRLEERIRRLKEDPFTLERLARYELGLVRPDDLVMVFPRAGGSPVAAAVPAVAPPAAVPPPAAPPDEPMPLAHPVGTSEAEEPVALSGEPPS